MKYNVVHFVCTCVNFQSTKSIYKKKYGLYKPLPILSKPWENVSMDFMTQLPEWIGMDAILVVVNRFSKLVKMAPTKMIVTTFNSAKLFFNMWVRHHGMPQLIISDRNAKFTASFCKHLFRKVGMKLSFSTAFHPQTNGQIEKVNGVLNQYLKNYVGTDQKYWGEHQGSAEFYYNSTTHLTTKMSLFELMLGKEPRN